MKENVHKLIRREDDSLRTGVERLQEGLDIILTKAEYMEDEKAGNAEPTKEPTKTKPCVEPFRGDRKMTVKNIPLIPPTELNQEIENQGYRGQEEARKAVCLCAYRHVKRLYTIHVQNTPREDIPPKPNTILMGPTGCGKTYILELLFGKILNIPHVLVEMTRFSETGYVGDDTLNILTRLWDVAGHDQNLAECGIIAMDEFDKLASSSSNMRFAGQGTTKDISGHGVQRELLKMVEGADIQIYQDYGAMHKGARNTMSTRDVTFLALGAFTGFKNKGNDTAGNTHIGFLANNVEGKKEDTIAYTLEQDEADEIGNFQTYGFMPELIARFTRTIPFQPLDALTLKNILKDKVIRYQTEFKEEGLDLEFDENVFDLIVKEALEREAGARGLESSLIKSFEEVSFQNFGLEKTGTVTVKNIDNHVISEVKLRA